MASIKQPSRYKSRITPYSQRLLQFGLEDSKVFLSKTANTILEAFTLGYDQELYDTTSGIINRDYEDRRDCILDGLKTSHELDGNTLNVTLYRGNLICDNTMLTFPRDTDLDLDLEPYDDTGFIVLSVNYQWIDNIYENAPKVRLSYVSEDTMTINPDDWWLDLDRLIITIFDFEKSPLDIVTSVTNRLNDPFVKLNREFVIVKNTPYEIAPLPNFWYHVMRGVHQNHGIRLTQVIDGDILNWNLDIPPFDGTGEYYYCIVNIKDIGRKDCIVQCYINDMKVEPAGIQHYNEQELRIWMPDYFVTQTSIPDLKVIAMG